MRKIFALILMLACSIFSYSENCSSCEDIKKQVEHQKELDDLKNNTISFEVYYSGLCRTCMLFTDEYVKQLQDDFSVYLRISEIFKINQKKEQLFMNGRKIYEGLYDSQIIKTRISDSISSHKASLTAARNGQDNTAAKPQLPLLQKLVVALICVGSVLAFFMFIRS